MPGSHLDVREQFVEVLFAPGYDETALEALVRKRSTDERAAGR